MITLLPYLFRSATYLDAEAINRNLRAMSFAFADITQRRYEYFTLHIPLDGLDSTMTAAQRTVRIPVAPSSIALPFDIVSVGMFAVTSANVTLTLQAVHDAAQFDSVDAVANQEATAGLDFVVINTGTAKEFRIDFSGIATLTSGYLLVLCRSDRFRNNSAPSDITWNPSYLNAATTPNAASLTSQLFQLDGKITQNDSTNYQNDVAVLGFGLVGFATPTAAPTLQARTLHIPACGLRMRALVVHAEGVAGATITATLRDAAGVTIQAVSCVCTGTNNKVVNSAAFTLHTQPTTPATASADYTLEISATGAAGVGVMQAYLFCV